MPMQTGSDVYIVGVLSALIATLLFGVTNVVYKRIDNDIGPLDITFTRIWVSLPLAYIFAVMAAGSIEFTIPEPSMMPLAVSMIFGIVIGDTLYFYSQERIGVSRAFPIAMSYPLLVYLLAAMFLEEPVILQRVFGAILVVLGIAAIARAESYQESSHNLIISDRRTRMGLVSAFLTVCCWALSDVIFQFGLTSVGAAEANFFRMLIASILLVPVFFISLKGGRSLPTRRTAAIALITGIFSIALSLLFYSYAVKYVGATITSVMVAAAPIVTAPLSAVYLKEKLGYQVLVGTILTVVGIVLVVVLI